MEELLRLEGVCKSFDTPRSLLSRFRGDTGRICAVDGVSFAVGTGEILGLIGESGCGKSTTAQLILRLLRPEAGTITFGGTDTAHLAGEQLAAYRRGVQMVFQDPYEYLHPHMTVLEAVREPLVIHKLVSGQAEMTRLVTELLEQVGLLPAEDYLHRYPHELSGGQRQRVAIARALIMEPKLLVADEPTSMLDVSVRAGILNLLQEAVRQRHMSMVFITHDIMTAGYMCDRIAVMYKGRVVELGRAEEIIRHPVHPYTKALVQVAMELKQFLGEKERYLLDGDPDRHAPNGFCAFYDRCVHRTEGCKGSPHDRVAMVQVGDDHFAACCNL